MSKNTSPLPGQSSSKSSSRVVCEDVRFAEVDFVRPVTPRIVIQFSGGLCLLLEDENAVELAADFITAFRRFEKTNAIGKEDALS